MRPPTPVGTARRSSHRSTRDIRQNNESRARSSSPPPNPTQILLCVGCITRDEGEFLLFLHLYLHCVPEKSNLPPGQLEDSRY